MDNSVDLKISFQNYTDRKLSQIFYNSLDGL
jgi:hypothetical protein